MANPNHDEKGRFASGSSAAAASGHHEAVSPHPERRNVGGLNVSRKVTVVAHNGVPSVGTGGNGSGGSSGSASGPGGSFNVRLKPKQTTTGLGRAARERAALNVATDRRHYPDDKADIQGRLKRRVLGI